MFESSLRGKWVNLKNSINKKLLCMEFDYLVSPEQVETLHFV